MSVLPEILALKERMSKDIIGQSTILDYLLVGMLSNGNVLVEGLPGLAKNPRDQGAVEQFRVRLQPYPVHARHHLGRHCRT